MQEELIKDLKTYNPKEVKNEVLQDDWRWIVTFWDSIRKGENLKYTKKEVLNCAKEIYAEIIHRINAGTMVHEFKSPLSLELVKEITEEHKNQVTIIGNTYNSGVDLEIGDLIKVDVTDISEYIDKETKLVYFKMYSPTVIGPGDKISTIQELEKLVTKTTGRVEEMTEKGQPPYVFDVHHASVLHGDWRFWVNEQIEGFTCAIVADKVKSPWNITTTECTFNDEVYYTITDGVPSTPTQEMNNKVIKYYKDLLDDDSNWKIDMKTGNPKKRANGSEKIWATKKVQCTTEGCFGWFKYQGLQLPDSIDPMSTGSTKNLPGVYTIASSGTVTKGVEKDYFFEYFLDGNWGNKRITFTKVKTSKNPKAKLYEQFTQSFEGMPSLLTGKIVEDDNPKGEMWLYDVPKDQTPYQLSKRALVKKFVTIGRSAIPPEMEKRIPSNLHYWRKDPKLTLADRLEMLKEAQKLFTKA